jgi:MFS family permease/HAMP domain-containing protein
VDAKYLHRVYWRISGVTMLLVVLALAANSYFSHRTFEAELVPEAAKKAVTVGASVRNLILKAVNSGIEYRSLYGVDRAFAEVFADNKEFTSMVATDGQGEILYQSGTLPEGARTFFKSEAILTRLAQAVTSEQATLVGAQYVVSVPLVHGEQRLGMLHIGIDRKFVDHIMLEILLDVLVVLVVALFFTLELLNFLAGAQLETGMRTLSDAVQRFRSGDFTGRIKLATRDEMGRILSQIDARVAQINANYQQLTRDLQAKLRDATPAKRAELQEVVSVWENLRARFRFGSATDAPAVTDAGLNRIRAPLFVFIMAEELTRSFLPGYINQLLVPIPGLSPQIVIGLPIVLFMLIVALGQPYLGAWSERVGRRRAMLIGAVLATGGFVATAMAHNLYDLLLWRSLCAVGYGMVFVSAQGYILDHSGPRDRAKGFALFIGAIMVATVCGPSIGGILADNIGFRFSFIAAAVLAGFSIFIIRLLPDDSQRLDQRDTKLPTMRDFGRLIVNRRFMVLTGLAAIPAKVVLTGVCFYLLPLYIVSIGSTQAMAGRMLMVYAVLMVLIVPVAAGASDRGTPRERLVAAGLCLSGLGGFLMLASDKFWVIFGLVISLGVGQALSIASQSALVAEHCKEEIATFGTDAVYGVYRLLERLGNALGPLLASVLVIYYGYEGAFVAISALVVVCGILFVIFTRFDRPVSAEVPA